MANCHVSLVNKLQVTGHVYILTCTAVPAPAEQDIHREVGGWMANCTAQCPAQAPAVTSARPAPDQPKCAGISEAGAILTSTEQLMYSYARRDLPHSLAVSPAARPEANVRCTPAFRSRKKQESHLAREPSVRYHRMAQPVDHPLHGVLLGGREDSRRRARIGHCAGTQRTESSYRQGAISCVML